MAETVSKRIVRPFGMLGSRYEIDQKEMWIYRIVYAICVGIGISLPYAADGLGLSRLATLLLFGALFCFALFVANYVARIGRKLD